MGFYVTEELLEDVPRAEARGNGKPHRGPIRRVESGYRFYSPELGRWVNRDPIEEESFKLMVVQLARGLQSPKLRNLRDQLRQKDVIRRLREVNPRLAELFARNLALYPIFPDLNLYGFVQNDPVNQYDILGLVCPCIEAANKSFKQCLTIASVAEAACLALCILDPEPITSVLCVVACGTGYKLAFDFCSATLSTQINACLLDPCCP